MLAAGGRSSAAAKRGRVARRLCRAAEPFGIFENLSFGGIVRDGFGESDPMSNERCRPIILDVEAKERFSRPHRRYERSPEAPTFRSEPSAASPDSGRLTKSERRLMHTLLDLEEGDRMDYEPKHLESVVEKLIALGYIEVTVTKKGRDYMNET